MTAAAGMKGNIAPASGISEAKPASVLFADRTISGPLILYTITVQSS